MRLYGETEFWFALIKVLVIIGMMGFGLWLLFSGHGGEKSQYRQPLALRWFLRHRVEWADFVAGGDYVLLGGLELVRITAAEARDPEKSFPKAVNQVVYRILLFYIGSLVVLGAVSVGGSGMGQ
ncbi:hypothetical protein ACLK17_03110 [Escherichia coli]